MNDIVPKSAGGMTLAERKAAVLAKVAKVKEEGTAPQAYRSGTVYAQYNGNEGGLTYGREKTPVPPDQKFVVVFDLCEHGIVKWEGSKVIDRRLTPVINGAGPQVPEGEPRVGDLEKPKHRDGWADTVNIVMVGIDGGDLENIQIGFDLANQSKMGSALELLSTIFDQCETKDGQEGMFNPVVTVEEGSYYNKMHTRDVFFPIFKIHEWTDGEKRIPAIMEGSEEAVDPLG